MNTTGNESADRAAVTVMIVDDHTVVREGLRVFLSSIADIDVVGDADSGVRALQDLSKMAALEHLPDVVLMDVSMPSLDGIETTARIRADYPSVQVIVLTSYGGSLRVQAALTAGAAGYVLKDAVAQEIATAVRAAAAGGVYIDPKVGRALAQSMVTGTPMVELTPREREVLALVARGKSNDGIAAALHISERTARTHVSHILSKLGLESRVQAALWGLKNGLATLD